jgi:hypothetical protein
VAVTVYKSSDTSAPTLSGTAGDLVNVLDKCLVAGYGSKTAAGWTKPYTGTNAAVFRMGGGNQFYLDVNDNAPGAAGAQEARIRGYETMTAVGTGTGPFPTTTQSTNGIFVRKSAAASGTTRTWTVVADDRTMYLLVQAGDSAGVWYLVKFGDFYSYLTGTDNYRTLIGGRTVENSVLASSEKSDQTSDLSVALNFGATGLAITRVYTGLGGSTVAGQFGDRAKAGGTAFNGNITFPNPADGNIWLTPLFLTDNATNVRGKQRGIVGWLHPIAGVADQDTVTGAGVYSGHTFLLFKQSQNSGLYCIDITGPWDTN